MVKGSAMAVGSVIGVDTGTGQQDFACVRAAPYLLVKLMLRSRYQISRRLGWNDDSGCSFSIARQEVWK